MGRSRPPRRFVGNVCAVWLVVLIVSPWTAPFATCDPANRSDGLWTRTAIRLSSTAPSAAVANPEDTVTPPPKFRAGRLRVTPHLEQMLITAAAWCVTPPALVPAADPPRTSSTPPDTPSTIPTVLRR